MTILVAIISLCLGLLIGYQLPIFLAWWRNFRYRKSFRFSILRPYLPTQQSALSNPDKSRK